MAYDANEVAKWILTEAKRQNVSMTHMKLQKLLYYIQAYYIGITGKPLFNNIIQAWQHGPVIPDVYRVYSKYGGKSFEIDDDIVIPEEFLYLVKTVVSDKGHLSVHILRNMTHKEKPWQVASNNHQDKTISNEMINEAFTDMFWTSDEEDDFQPYFDNPDYENSYFHNQISDEEKNAILKSR